MNRQTLVAVQVGLPQTRQEGDLLDDREYEWKSGIYKEPIAGHVWVGKLNLTGDGQADLLHHGGPDRPILAYSADHYAFWQDVLGRPELPFGMFGENFTVSGAHEDSVCLGDVYQVGDAVIEVSQPRIPCWKLGRRTGSADVPARAATTGRTGWYLRVLHEGHVTSGQTLTLVERPWPDWSITRAHQVYRGRRLDRYAALALAGCQALSTDWRRVLTET